MARVVDNKELRARDLLDDRLQITRRCRGILGAGDCERGRRDAVELAACVPVAYRLARTGIALARNREQHLAVASHVAKRGSEPAFEDCVHDRRDTVATDPGGAVLPDAGAREAP